MVAVSRGLAHAGLCAIFHYELQSKINYRKHTSGTMQLTLYPPMWTSCPAFTFIIIIIFFSCFLCTVSGSPKMEIIGTPSKKWPIFPIKGIQNQQYTFKNNIKTSSKNEFHVNFIPSDILNLANTWPHIDKPFHSTIYGLNIENLCKILNRCTILKPTFWVLRVLSQHVVWICWQAMHYDRRWTRCIHAITENMWSSRLFVENTTRILYLSNTNTPTYTLVIKTSKQKMPKWKTSKKIWSKVKMSIWKKSKLKMSKVEKCRKAKMSKNVKFSNATSKP